MFHLVFQNHKHRSNPYYLNRNTNRASTHNQFELDTIRASLKSRWEVTGFGKTDFQTKIWDIESIVDSMNSNPHKYIREYFHGHIITVDSSADAIWFRLNHENVSKNGNKLVEVYADIDVEYITSLTTALTARHVEYSNYLNITQVCNNVNYSAYRFARNTLYDEIPAVKNGADKITDAISEFSKFAQINVDRYKKKYLKEARVLFDYLDSKKTKI